MSPALSLVWRDGNVKVSWPRVRATIIRPAVLIRPDSSRVRPASNEDMGKRSSKMRSCKPYWSLRFLLPAGPARPRSVAGSIWRPIKAINKVPASSTGKPISAKSNKSKPAWLLFSSAILTNKLGGVPIKVSKPPSIAPNAIGISTFAGAIPQRRAASTVTGNNNATTPILLINADNKPATSIMTIIICVSLLPDKRITLRPMLSAMPARVKPSLMMNMAQTVITAGLLKPLTASAGDTSCSKASAHNSSKATTSIRSHSVTNKTKATSSSSNTSAISRVIAARTPLITARLLLRLKFPTASPGASNH